MEEVSAEWLENGWGGAEEGQHVGSVVLINTACAAAAAVVVVVLSQPAAEVG